MRVDLLGQKPDAFAQLGREARVFVGKGEGFEAAGFVVARPVFQRATLRQRPDDVHAAGQHAKVEGVVAGDGDQHVVGQDAGVQKLEGAVLGGFDGGDVAGQAGERRTQVFARFAKQPPVVPISGAVVLVALGLHTLQQPLVYGGKLRAHLLGRQAKQVDYLHAARNIGQVAAVAVIADDGRRGRSVLTPALSQGARKQGCGFCRGDDKARTMQLDARRRNVGVGPQRNSRRHVGADAQVRMNHTAALRQRDRHLAELAGLLRRHGEQTACPMSREMGV